MNPKFAMKIISSLSILMLTEAIKREKYCDPLTFNLTKHCFYKEVLVSMAHSPNQLAVDKSDCLYFSFDYGHGEYVPAKVIIGQENITILKGVKDAFAISHDNNTNDVFFGGSHGIYKYNPTLKTLLRLSIQNLDIWWIFVKKNIYFIKFPSLSAFSYINKTVRYFNPLRNHSVHQFVFDVDDNIFFINSTGLYGIKNGGTLAQSFKHSTRFLGITVDNFGYVYAAGEDGIYVVSRITSNVKKIMNVQGVLGMAFDTRNNIIYSDSQEIVRLSPIGREEFHKAVTKA